MLAEHGYARYATVFDTYVDSTFSSNTMIDSRLVTLSTDRNWSICEKFQIYRMYEVLEVMPRNPSGPMPGSSSRRLSSHSDCKTYAMFVRNADSLLFGTCRQKRWLSILCSSETLTLYIASLFTSAHFRLFCFCRGQNCSCSSFLNGIYLILWTYRRSV